MEFEDVWAEVSKLSASLVHRSKNGKEGVAVAAALMYAAAVIHKEIGGSKYAARQFYAVADSLAVENDQSEGEIP